MKYDKKFRKCFVWASAQSIQKNSKDEFQIILEEAKKKHKVNWNVDLRFVQKCL